MEGEKLDQASVLTQLRAIEAEALQAIEAAESLEALEEVKVRTLGRKGALTGVLRNLGDLPSEIRPEIGRFANLVKGTLEHALAECRKALEERLVQALLVKERLDPTLPGHSPTFGSLHPLTQVLDEILEIFQHLGFKVVEGPEVELDYYNFEALNMPKDHPARDMQDTFYVTDEVLLRTHTSPVQIRVMELKAPPIQIVVPGKVYRRDADISHSPMFHQVEGLLVDEGVTFADLKGTLQVFAERLFGKQVRLRFRPSFFPFTEPSAEVDVLCIICGGTGCRVCKGSGWLEILGAGMVDPDLFKRVGYDAERYTGFAFGMGVERITMLKFGIDDIRLFFDNDLRFLKQFQTL
ncbi:MAG: phenylalanine--tRNA ligase subunit alpha [candidate division NC10 bacterium]|nr:phenylalanine--tRNA ligase subunit alpha [candidate division NC10 bacterium]